MAQNQSMSARRSRKTLLEPLQTWAWLKPQGLAFVSIYEGAILVPFFEPEPYIES